MSHRCPALTLDRFRTTGRSAVLNVDRPAFDDSRAGISLSCVGVPVDSALASRPITDVTALATVVRSTLRVPGKLRRIHDLPERRFPVAQLDFSKPDIRLPFGVPRFVNARTLKLMAGGGRADRLLRQVGKEWEFVDDDVQIDLDDASKRFRVGRVTIFS